MDNKILYTAKFTHHDLKFHKVWWKSDKRCGSWSGQTNSYIPPQTMFAGGIIICDVQLKHANTISLLPMLHQYNWLSRRKSTFWWIIVKLSANVFINYCLPNKVYHRIYTVRDIRIEIIHGSQNVFWVVTWVDGY